MNLSHSFIAWNEEKIVEESLLKLKRSGYWVVLEVDQPSGSTYLLEADWAAGSN